MPNDGPENTNTSIADEIAAHNARIDEGGADEEIETVLDDPEAGAAPATEEAAAPAPPAAEEEEGKGNEPAGEEKPAGEALQTVDEEVVAGTYVFTPDLPIEKFNEQKAAYFEEFEVTPEVTQMFDYLETQIQNYSSMVESVEGAEPGKVKVVPAAKAAEIAFEPYGGPARVEKTMTALKRLVEINIDGNAGNEIPRPNAKPVVELFKTDYSREFSEIAAEILMSDSMRYPGASVFQEVVMDVFHVSPQKFGDVYNYLIHNAPLPEYGTAESLPAGIDETLRDAFWAKPERMRFELESLANEIAQLERDMGNLDSYYKEEAQKKLTPLKEKFADEIQQLVQIQKGINSTKSTEQITQRQQADAAAVFSRELEQEYLGETFDLSQGFVDVIAPQLTFLDEKMRTSYARSLVARVASALSFLYDPRTFAFVADPAADVYAAQFKEEGITFDFVQGRELLYKHLLACRKVKVIKQAGLGQASLDEAEREKKAILKEIKAGQTEIIGQMTALSVTSAGTALKKKVDEAAGKKQAVRRIVNTAGGVAPAKDSPDKVARDRAAHNARIDAETDQGDDLADIVFDRKPAAAAAK